MTPTRTFAVPALLALLVAAAACEGRRPEPPQPARQQPKEAAPAEPVPPAPEVQPAHVAKSGAAAAAPAAEASATEGLTAEEKRDIEVFRRASAAVVFITNIAKQQDFWSMTEREIPQGSGSGFVWDAQGHIVTNFHVVDGASALQVTLSDKSTWDAELVGAAPNKDLAVVRIKAPASRLTPLPVGSSGTLLVGQRVLAIGNPFGLDHTLTVGVVSALGRDLQSPGGRRIKDVVQTDAAINPGNSGGPLLDSSGRLIGVNAAIYSPSGASAGIGFAIPVDAVKRLVPQMIERGQPVQPGIGIEPWRAGRIDIKGVIVRAVTRGGPADKAGIEGIQRTRRGLALGDVIVAVNGKPVANLDEMADAFDAAGVGKTVTLTVVRDDKKREVQVTLRDLSEQ